MGGRDGRLHLIGARPVVAHRLVHQRKTFLDFLRIPHTAILVLQQHRLAIGIKPRRQPRLLQQHKGRQTHDLRLGLEQAQQQPREADRLVAQRRSRRIIAGAVAFVEQQIEHRRHHTQPLRALHRTGRLERHIGPRDTLLGAGNPLFHGSLAHQEGARDLGHRQAGDNAQRQRNLLGCRQVGMTADEQQPQHIVAILRAVQPLHQRGFDIIQVRDHVIRRQHRVACFLAHAIQRRIAAHQNKPRRGITRRAVFRPVLQRAQTGFLIGLFRPVHVAEIAQQRANRLGAGGRDRAIDPRQIGHQYIFSICVGALGRVSGTYSAMGRIS